MLEYVRYFHAFVKLCFFKSYFFFFFKKGRLTVIAQSSKLSSTLGIDLQVWLLYTQASPRQATGTGWSSAFWCCAFQLGSYSPPFLTAQDFTMWKAATPFLLSLALVFTKFTVSVMLIVQLSKRPSFITLWKISFSQSIGCFWDILKTAR